MSTHYIEDGSSGSQYYFNANSSTTSQSHRNYSSPVRTTTTTTFGSSDYPTYPVGISGTHSPHQQIRLDRNIYNQDDTYQLPQQHQSVAGFNKNITQQQHYQPPQSPVHQVRATVRTVNSQDQYHSQRTSEPIQVSPQQHHFQFDSHQQPGRPTGPPVVYQTPGAAQYTHRNVDLWTENPSQGHDHHVQAQRVSVRPVSTGSPQQSHSISPPQHRDHLEQYYSQLTPEQHQQLLRQQQIQRQQENRSYYEQQQRQTVPIVVAAPPQQSPPSSSNYHQEQFRATASVGGGGGQHHQHVSPIQRERGRSETERQRQDEQAYYAAQRHMATQRVQQEQEETPQPVGIRNLMNKFTGPKPVQTYAPRSKSSAASSSRHYSTSSYSSRSGPSQTTTTRTSTIHSMTYSALPKPQEPPVNSIEYYQMQLQQQGGNPFTNIQQAAAPAHIQHTHTPTGFGALRDQFKTGSYSDNLYQTQNINQRPQQQQQQQQTNTGGNTLSSLRNQYMNRAKESSQDEYATQQVQNISRTIIGEDSPQQKKQQIPQQQQPPPVAQVYQQQEQVSAPQVLQQEQTETQNQNVDQQAAASSEVKSSPPPAAANNDTTTAEPTPSSN